MYPYPYLRKLAMLGEADYNTDEDPQDVADKKAEDSEKKEKAVHTTNDPIKYDSKKAVQQHNLDAMKGMSWKQKLHFSNDGWFFPSIAEAQLRNLTNLYREYPKTFAGTAGGLAGLTLGATGGALLSKQNKLRNAIIAGLVSGALGAGAGILYDKYRLS